MARKSKHKRRSSKKRNNVHRMHKDGIPITKSDIKRLKERVKTATSEVRKTITEVPPARDGDLLRNTTQHHLKCANRAHTIDSPEVTKPRLDSVARPPATNGTAGGDEDTTAAHYDDRTQSPFPSHVPLNMIPKAGRS
ncbi:hypothetical protein CF319_g6964 [Tilletia indica]|nr:hypothetical protein CF319_g6964 [Tilletia indica]